MRATFIGHQTWLIEHKSTKILVDPLLRPEFGSTPGFNLDIYPPRIVDVNALNDVDVIFLSHEHSDHFDLQSLDLLPRSAKFIVGSTVVTPVKNSIRLLGFEVFEVNDSRPIDIGRIVLRFYPADPRTAFWESRVTQIHAEERGSRNGGIFIAVDALVSKEYKEDLKTGQVRCPRLVVVSNNSRVAPPGAFQSLENWGAGAQRDARKKGSLGVSVLTSVLTSYLEDFPMTPENVVMCGGGFIKKFDGFAAFPFSDHDEMGALANQLSLDVNVVGLRPGEVMNLSGQTAARGRIDWITIDDILHQKLRAELKEFIKYPKEITSVDSLLPDYPDKFVFNSILPYSEAELERLAKSILLFITGRRALEMSLYKENPLGSKRIAISFRGTSLETRKTYGLNILTGKFEPEEEESLDNLYAKYPFGLDIPLVDFLGMVDGEIQIWDIVGVSIRSWFVGSIFEGLIPFLYCYYGENGSPELLEKILRKKLFEMGKLA